MFSFSLPQIIHAAPQIIKVIQPVHHAAPAQEHVIRVIQDNAASAGWSEPLQAHNVRTIRVVDGSHPHSW